MATLPSTTSPSGSTLSSVLSYLDLPPEYEPSPLTNPTAFLTAHIRLLPPHLLKHFSEVITAKQRTAIPIIRNRRLKYTQHDPLELQLSAARSEWPSLWRRFQPESEKPGARPKEDGEDEKHWVETSFIGGGRTHVGKLGSLLSGYEEERGWERERAMRRQNAQDDFVPEEDDDTDEDEELPPPSTTGEPRSFEQSKESFERVLKERFIYGLLDSIDYDTIDWDDSLDDEDDRDAEERWFDGEDEE